MRDSIIPPNSFSGGFLLEKFFEIATHYDIIKMMCV
jgi:hypothetical protein